MGDGRAISKGTDRSIRPDATLRPAPDIGAIPVAGSTRMTRRFALTRPARVRAGEARKETRIDRHSIPLHPAGMAVRRRAGPCPRYRPPTGRQEGECR